MAASYDKNYVDYLQEELRKRDTEIQELTSELVAKRQALESAEEWLDEAMNLRDAAQARVDELQQKCATLNEELATLKEAFENGDAASASVESTSKTSTTQAANATASCPPNNRMIIDTYLRYGDDVQRYKGFLLAHRCYDSHFVCLRCFAVLRSNTSNITLVNHFKRAVCEKRNGKFEARMARIKTIFEKDLQKKHL